MFLAVQAVPIKTSHFYNKITLKRLDQKLSVHVFAMLRSTGCPTKSIDKRLLVGAAHDFNSQF